MEARVTTAEGDVDALEGRLDIQATKVSLLVGGTDANPTIKPAGIVAAINGGSSSVVISANHINLDGVVWANHITTNFLNGQIASIPTLTGIAANFSGNVSASGIIARDGLYFGSSPSTNVNTAIAAVQITGPTNNQYKLQYKRFVDSSWTDAGTFSRAITSMSGSWSNGIYTVTATPQNQTKSSDALTVASGQAYRDGDLLYVPVYAGTTSTGYSAWVNWKNLLTSRSNCVAGLSVYNSSSKVELFYKSGETTYRSAGSHYWYYRDTTSSLHTYYS